MNSNVNTTDKTSVIILGEHHEDSTMRRFLVQLQTILEQQGKKYCIGYEGCIEDTFPLELKNIIDRVHAEYDKRRNLDDNLFFKFNDAYIKSLQKYGIVFPIDDKIGAYNQQSKDINIKFAELFTNKYIASCVSSSGIKIRDKSMAKKTLLCIQQEQSDIIILLCGADHITGVSKILTDHNIVFTSVTNMPDIKANYIIKKQHKEATHIHSICSYILHCHNEKVERSVNKNYQ